jgi:hypothetical protein
MFRERGVHDYNAQGQGPENKVLLDAVIVANDGLRDVKLSCYRPMTKEGDPRFWPYLFSQFASADDVFAVFVHAGRVHFLNLTQSSLGADMRSRRETCAARFFAGIGNAAHAVADELLRLLREIANRGPLEAVCGGDTAIGRSIEAALGIDMNSRQAPDYRGIELKSYRSTKPENGLITLFSKTPDWSRSVLKRSSDYLPRFGYSIDGRLQLYCSVHSTKANSQGLRLDLNTSANDLEEFHKSNPSEVLAVWSMDTLHTCFREKHAETFWISADTLKMPGGRECFTLRSVLHTRRPIIPQFDSFILDGQICLDHTIKQKGAAAKDHGYLFRVRHENFTDLFTGEPRTYALC